jgi:hypothetical protein
LKEESMHPDTPLHRQLISVMAANREDSFATQRSRKEHLAGVATLLHSHFGLQKWDNLKMKHVDEIVRTWKQQDNGRRAIEGKLSNLRWLVRKIGKANLVPWTNAELGIEPGKIISDADLREMLARVPDPRVRAMMLLARHLGLRFEEASLFRPWRDAEGGRVWVKRGTKGGMPRFLLLHNREQVDAIGFARSLTQGDRGLIPETFATYEKWRQHVYPILRNAGLSRETDVTFHDLRRTYFVIRMEYLLSVGERSNEDAAALVAREAGHHRTEVLQWYLSARAPRAR